MWSASWPADSVARSARWPRSPRAGSSARSRSLRTRHDPRGIATIVSPGSWQTAGGVGSPVDPARSGDLIGNERGFRSAVDGSRALGDAEPAGVAMVSIGALPTSPARVTTFRRGDAGGRSSPANKPAESPLAGSAPGPDARLQRTNRPNDALPRTDRPNRRRYRRFVLPRRTSVHRLPSVAGTRAAPARRARAARARCRPILTRPGSHPPRAPGRPAGWPRRLVGRRRARA